MKLSQLEYVIKVAQYQSFAKASKKLFVSQPALSTAVASLEEELGVSIFHRTPHGVVPTEEGDRILSMIDEILAMINDLRAVANTQQSYNRTIAAIPAMCNSMMIQLLKEFSTAHTEISLNILEIRPQNILQSLSNGIADIAIGSYNKNTRDDIMQKALKNEFEIEPLFDDHLCAFFHRTHPEARRTHICAAELPEEKQAVYNDYIILGDTTSLDNEFIQSSRHYVFSDRTSIKQAVAEGLAYTVLPHQMVLDDVYCTSGLIKGVPIIGDNVTLTNYVAYRKNKHLSPQDVTILDSIRGLAHETEQRLKALVAKLDIDLNDADYSCLKY